MIPCFLVLFALFTVPAAPMLAGARAHRVILHPKKTANRVAEWCVDRRLELEPLPHIKDSQSVKEIRAVWNGAMDLMMGIMSRKIGLYIEESKYASAPDSEL